MAAGDLTTLQNVRDVLGLTANTDDALLVKMIARESAFIDQWCSRVFQSTAYTGVVLNGKGTAGLVVPNYPVTAVASVEVCVGPVSWVTVPATAYAINPMATGLLRTDGDVFPQDVANVRLAFTAGYVTIPADLEGACADLVAYRYRERSRIGERSKVLPGGETVAFLTGAMPEHVRAVLNQYRRVYPG